MLTPAEKKELKLKYRQTPRQAGVFVVTNLAEDRFLLASSRDLPTALNRHRFLLDHGGHHNARLQADWKRLGPECFRFEVLASVEEKDDPAFDLEDELCLLEWMWTDKLKPTGERAYNDDPNLRR